MRYTVDSRLCAADAEAELDRLVNSTRENDGTPDIKTYGESSHFKVYRYRLPSGARAGIAMDVSELLETQKQPLCLAMRPKTLYEDWLMPALKYSLTLTVMS